MKEYSTPEIELINIESVDIIETSSLTPEDSDETRNGIFDGILEWM